MDNPPASAPDTTTLMTATEMIADIDSLISLNKNLAADAPNNKILGDKCRGRINKLLDSRLELMKIRDKQQP
jgi:hypothetical protein